ncbi:MAG TPA: YggS family pyridoxal phosphate-dependent enzyme [Acidimicrobiales bacterium]|nr:YggS family pyridoxal phosphate-dependent enzyme [Acidimicrobiales bacterium]
MIPCTVPAAELAARLAGVRRRIEAAGGDPEAVRVVGVTKGFDRSAVERAREAGLADLGESYAQEMVAKAPGPEPGLRWHWVGRLQRNKVRQVAPLVALWHSIDRAELGAEVARRAPGASVLAQVNTSGEASKAGCPPGRVAALVADLRAEGLAVAGLMTVAAPGPAAARACFRTLRELADDLGLPERSMGMSDDLEAAVAEGATLVRVGTALFGPRGGGVASAPDTTS